MIDVRDLADWMIRLVEGGGAARSTRPRHRACTPSSRCSTTCGAERRRLGEPRSSSPSRGSRAGATSRAGSRRPTPSFAAFQLVPVDRAVAAGLDLPAARRDRPRRPRVDGQGRARARARGGAARGVGSSRHEPRRRRRPRTLLGAPARARVLRRPRRDAGSRRGDRRGLARTSATSNANTSGPYETSRRTEALDGGRATTAGRFLGCAWDEAVFGPNMTTLIFALSRTAGREFRPGDEILCTKLDHDANVSPWLELAHDRDLTVRFVDINEDTTPRPGRPRSGSSPTGRASSPSRSPRTRSGRSPTSAGSPTSRTRRARSRGPTPSTTGRTARSTSPRSASTC